MKNVKRVLSVFFLLVFIFSCFPEDVLAVDTIPNAVLNSTKSVVRIKADYGIVTSSGSGFVIESSNSRTLVVTNDHVIEGSPASISVYVGQEDAVSAHVLSTSSQKDICVLELSYPVNIPPVKLSSSEAKQGDIVYAVGFPGASDTLSDKTAQTSDEATITSGIVSAVRGLTTSAYGSSVSIIQINADLNSGNSGGPLFNSEGHVVGINTYGISSAQGVNGAINVSELEAFLLENNISVLSSSSGGSSAVWFVISASLLVICAVAAFLLIRRKCCKRAEGGEKKMKIRKRTHPRVILSEYMLQSPRGLGINLAVSSLMPVLLQIRDMHNNGNLHLQLSPFTLTVSEEGFFANPPSENAGAKYTPGFAAPEIYTEKGISTATDTYSLAALLYYCVCGKTPVNAINRAPGENIDIPETIQDSNFAEILKKGLSYEPSERFSSVQELVHALSPYNISPVLSQQDVLPAVPATEIHSAGETNAEPLPEQSPETEGSIMRKSVKKNIAIVVSAVLGSVVLLAGIYWGTYFSACKHVENEEFSKANKLLFAPSITELHDEKLIAYIDAGIAFENRQFSTAMDAFKALSDYSNAIHMFNESTYRCAAQLADSNDFVTSLKYYSALRKIDYKDSDELYNDTLYRQGIYQFFEVGEYIEGYETLGSVPKDYPGIQDILSECQEYLYALGQEAYYSEDYHLSKRYFTALEGYGRSADYLTLLDVHMNTSTNSKIFKYYTGQKKVSSLVGALEALIGFEDAAELLVSTQDIASEYLLGYWTSSGGSFQMGEDRRTNYYLPWFNYGDYYTIFDGHYVLYKEGDYSAYKNLFDFYPISANTCEVYCYNNGRTYTLTRSS